MQGRLAASHLPASAAPHLPQAAKLLRELKKRLAERRADAVASAAVEGAPSAGPEPFRVGVSGPPGAGTCPPACPPGQC